MRTLAITALAASAALLAATTGASAQATGAFDRAQAGPEGPPPQAARPYGATYIPGVGFRYVARGGGARVYGYQSRGYRAVRGRHCRGDAPGDYCLRR